MYRIYDKNEAIRVVQVYLMTAGDPDIAIAPTGIYDENTKLSVIDFQRRFNLEPTGEVDYETFTVLYSEHSILTKNKDTADRTNSFIKFPLLPGRTSNGISHINLTLGRVLDYYGFTHNLRENNFYSSETAMAVELLRDLYMLDKRDYIDEEFYRRLIIDHDSIAKLQKNSI